MPASQQNQPHIAPKRTAKPCTPSDASRYATNPSATSAAASMAPVSHTLSASLRGLSTTIAGEA